MCLKDCGADGYNNCGYFCIKRSEDCLKVSIILLKEVINKISKLITLVHVFENNTEAIKPIFTGKFLLRNLMILN